MGGAITALPSICNIMNRFVGLIMVDDGRAVCLLGLLGRGHPNTAA